MIHISTNNKGNESICFLPLQELLGDRLLTSPHRDGETSLPSPNQLRHKIILKNKKLRPAKKTSATTTAMTHNSSSSALQHLEKQGLVFPNGMSSNRNSLSLLRANTVDSNASGSGGGEGQPASLPASLNANNGGTGGGEEEEDSDEDEYEDEMQGEANDADFYVLSCIAQQDPSFD